MILADPSPWPAVVDHVIVALLTVAVPSFVTVWWGNKKRQESHQEHGETSYRLESIAEMAAVVSHQAESIAKSSIQDREHLSRQITENTALTIEAATASKEAAAVANNVNEKIALTNERITEAMEARK